MINIARSRVCLKYINVLLCIAVLFLTILPLSPVVSAKDSQGYQIMVSLGDSFSSGESIEKFYGQDKSVAEKVRDQDWLAHRSTKSWSGMLMLPSSTAGNKPTMSEYHNKNWYFVATSGAKTEHMEGTFVKDYRKYVDPISGRPVPITGNNIVKVIDGSGNIDPQLRVFDRFGKGEVDYVTLTLGGNDADFVGVVAKAANPLEFLVPGTLYDMLVDTKARFNESGGIRDKLYDAYKKIADRAGAETRIIVAGYPKLLEQNGKGALFSKKEATDINNAVSWFNDQINILVNSCKSSDNMKICFVSIEKEFDGHEAYSKNSYMNKLILGTRSEDLKDGEFYSGYSMHPNEEGAKAYARCVQKKINDIEKDDGRSEWSEWANPDKFDSVITLVCDVSGSMNDRTETGETKLEALKEAGTVITGMVESWSQQYAGAYGIGVVQFSSGARSLTSPHINYPFVNQCIRAMGEGGGTNISSGLEVGIGQLNEISAKSKVIILMTDGIDNSHSAILRQAEIAKENNIRVFTIGFGSTRSEIQEDILTQVADMTGGEYRYADTTNIVGIIGGFMYAQQASEAKVLTDQQGFVNQGETTSAKSFTVPDDMGDLNCILYWPGSILDLIITDPNGRIVDKDYPGAVINNSTIPASVTVSDPLPGSWKMKVKGVETSPEYEDGEPYYAITSFKRVDIIDLNATPELETLELTGAYCLPIGFFVLLMSVMMLIFVNAKKTLNANAVTEGA